MGVGEKKEGQSFDARSPSLWASGPRYSLGTALSLPMSSAEAHSVSLWNSRGPVEFCLSHLACWDTHSGVISAALLGLEFKESCSEELLHFAVYFPTEAVVSQSIL